MKKALFGLVFSIGVATILVGGYRIIWPIIDAEGSITSGQFRGIYIGEAKVDVEIEVMIPGRQKLKLIGFVDVDGRHRNVPTSDCRGGLDESATWILTYPGIHQEIVRLTFLDERVARIEYERDMLSP